MFLKNLAILLIFIFLIACEKDPSASKTEHKVSVKGAFILNEGNFMHRNASLSFYDFEQQNIQNNIYETVNAVALGDVLQSMTIIDTLGFLAVNNSHKIEVISLNTWKKVATINMDGKGPRAIADGGNGNVYVTNMNSGNVSVIRISDFTEQALITVGAQPDEIVAQNQKAYVANSGWGYDHTVSVIDLNQNKVIKTINVADNPGYLISDKNEDIHVLCTGR
jgi:YVTN family beta-propeller protein